LNIDAVFVRSAAGAGDFPADAVPEIALVGRSNVGKSSLINALAGRRALARTSNMPGRTQELVFFGSSVPLVLVDLPGYGYAAAAKRKIAAWTKLIHDYLRGRPALARVYVLIDARHGIKPADDAILDTLGQAAVSHQIVLTKCDVVGDAELSSRIEALTAALAKRPAAYPQVLATSARSGAGIVELRAAIARLVRERDRTSGRRHRDR
jgi:GTP-binding protein